MESALYFPAPLGDVGWGNDRLGGLRPITSFLRYSALKGAVSRRRGVRMDDPPRRGAALEILWPSNSAFVPQSCAETEGKRTSLRISFSAAGHALGLGPNLGYAFLNQCDCQFF
jgi:hypothetical protein